MAAQLLLLMHSDSTVDSFSSTDQFSVLPAPTGQAGAESGYQEGSPGSLSPQVPTKPETVAVWGLSKD